MKIPLNEAAAKLRCHPCEVILELTEMIRTFDELYPEVDEGFIETLKRMHPERFDRPSSDSCQIQETSVSNSDQGLPHLSEDAERLVCILSHKKHWGTNTVSEDTLRNHYCRNLQNCDSAIKELIRSDILMNKSLRGPFSLKTKAKGKVDAVIRKYER